MPYYEIPTVKVIDGDGYKIINEVDFDPAVDKLYKVRKKPGPKPKVPKPGS